MANPLNIQDFNLGEIVTTDQHTKDISDLDKRIADLESKFGTHEKTAETLCKTAETAVAIQKLMQSPPPH